jgi:transcription initiation factor TFIID subunit 7
VLDNVNPDLSDSEFIAQDDGLEVQTPGGHSEPGDAGIPGEGADGDESDEEGEEGEADGDIDEELSTELDRELEGEDDDEDDEDEDDETQQARQLLNEEIADLEFAVHKEAEVASTGNPLIRKRFKDALKKLCADLEVKMGQKDEMIEMARLRKAGAMHRQRACKFIKEYGLPGVWVCRLYHRVVRGNRAEMILIYVCPMTTNIYTFRFNFFAL